MQSSQRSTSDATRPNSSLVFTPARLPCTFEYPAQKKRRTTWLSCFQDALVHALAEFGEGLDAVLAHAAPLQQAVELAAVGGCREVIVTADVAAIDENPGTLRVSADRSSMRGQQGRCPRDLLVGQAAGLQQVLAATQ